MVDIQLYFLVFVESLLNDGVTVVLYNTMIALGGLEVVEYMQYVLAFFRNQIHNIFWMALPTVSVFIALFSCKHTF